MRFPKIKIRDFIIFIVHFRSHFLWWNLEHSPVIIWMACLCCMWWPLLWSPKGNLSTYKQHRIKCTVSDVLRLLKNCAHTWTLSKTQSEFISVKNCVCPSTVYESLSVPWAMGQAYPGLAQTGPAWRGPGLKFHQCWVFSFEHVAGGSKYHLYCSSSIWFMYY